VLLPIPMLPVAPPPFLAAVKVTAGALDDAFRAVEPLAGVAGRLRPGVGRLAVLTFEFILEDYGGIIVVIPPPQGGGHGQT
jgi:hypothetical protein